MRAVGDERGAPYGEEGETGEEDDPERPGAAAGPAHTGDGPGPGLTRERTGPGRDGPGECEEEARRRALLAKVREANAQSLKWPR